ncbi:MAG: hypothetical protein ACREFP_11280 [Acetobacteraceae bacterium]
MTAENDPTRSEHDAPEAEAEAAHTAHRIAEGILADLKRSGRQAQADRLTEILLLLADGEALKDPLPAPPPAE